MATQRFIDLDANGNFTEIVPATSSAGSATAGQIVALNTSGLVDATMLPGTNVTMMTASESIATGALINVWNSPSVPAGPAIRSADNSVVGKEANGFVLSSVASGASGAVTLREGAVTGLSGLTTGAQYFLSTVGSITATVPVAPNVLQKVGRALSATSLNFVEHQPITRN